MLQVYDRVIPGRSLPTLAGLAIIAATLFIFQGTLELLRSMLLARVGMSLDERMNRKVFGSLIYLPTRAQTPDDGLQSVRDLEQVRSFLSGSGSTALFDLPWMPFYLILCFLFHFWIGFTALCGAVLLIVPTALAEILSQKPALEAAKSSAARLGFAQAARRNWEAVVAMGFSGRLTEKWTAMNEEYLGNQLSAGNIVGTLTTIAKNIADDVAVRCIGCRRDPCHQAGGDGRHHHRQLDHGHPRLPPWSWQSGNGRALSGPAKVGRASPSCWTCPYRNTGPWPCRHRKRSSVSRT